MTADLTLTSARTQRDALAGRVDVLDKVKVLHTLPDDMHVTTDMVAEFYEVSIELIRRVVTDHRDELDDDGYRVLTRSAFESEFGSLSNLDPRARQIALFPRRAVLRIGMLLRDSTIARRVRNYLLEAEESGRDLSEDEIVMRALEIQGRKVEALTAANRQLTEKIAEDAPKVNYVELYVADGDLLKLRTVAANNDVGEEWLRDLLLARAWIYVETESRWSNSKGCKEIRRRYSAYAHKRGYFRPVEVHESPRFKGEVYHTLKVTPAGAEAIARLISKEHAA